MVIRVRLQVRKTQDLPEDLVTGARCQVDLLSGSGTKGSNQRKGTVKFVGSTKFATGVWVVGV